jgi:transcriptional regulator with XRE-family HTH domain
MGVEGMHIGEKIRKVLEERGISQKQFAIETGIAAPKLNLILTGKRRLKIEELEIICYVLNVDFNTFLTPRPPKKKSA